MNGNSELNKIKLKEEKNRLFFESNPSGLKIKLKYPHLHDMNLQKTIALKKEFQHTKYDGELKELTKKNTSCNYDNFTLAPHQEFVKMYISNHTPYNGLLLYHGMGSGKTCSAIGICEEFRKSNQKHTKKPKKIMIIASPNVQDNFKLQLFDPKKLSKKDGIWKLDGCVGESLLREINFFDIQSLSKDDIIAKMKKQIRNNYEFIGYVEFANKVNRIISKSVIWEKEFDLDDMVIRENGNKNNAGQYVGDNMDSHKYTETTTNLYNKHHKVIGHKTIRYSLTTQQKMLLDVFSERMLVVDEVHNIRSLGDSAPTKLVSDAFQTLLKFVRHMKLLFLSGTPMYNDPTEILFIVNLLNINDGQSALKKKEVFNKKGDFVEGGAQKLLFKSNGYISYIRGENPYQFPYKIFPNDYNSDKSLKKMIYPRKQFNGLSISKPIQHLDLYVTRLSASQQKAYEQILREKIDKLSSKESERFSSTESFKYTILQDPLNALTFCLNDDNGGVYTGKDAFNEIVVFSEDKYSYIDDSKRVFRYEMIGDYSSKIKSILDAIQDSEGIILIYSQYLDAGLLPIALALEEMGYKRNSSSKNKSLLNIPAQEIVGSYAMITGDVRFSKSNKEELQLLNHSDNIDGDLCKVVLISQAGSEGLDFKNLRQLHVLEPWYNLNRIDQIIGRAIRHCSHKELKLKKRNCQIFLHASSIEEDIECVDMMMYRLSEEKSKKIGKVQKLLKSISADCLLNHGQQNFANLEEELRITLSNNQKIKFQVKDKNYSSICDYDICEYTCHSKIDSANEVNNYSYDYQHMIRENVIKQLKKLYQKQHVYKKKQIIEILQDLNKNTSLEHILFGLHYLIENENELLVDKYMRKGRLVNVKNLYMFQPLEVQTPLSLQETQRLFQNSKDSLLQKVKVVQNHESENENVNVDKNLVMLNDVPDSPIPKKKKTLLDTVLDRILNYYNLAFSSGQTHDDDDDEVEFYTLYDKTVQIIQKFFPTKFEKINDYKKQFIIEHILEKLHFKDEKQLITFLFNPNSSLDELQKLIKSYYQTYVYDHEKYKILFLVDFNKKKSKAKEEVKKIKYHIRILIFQNNEWKDATLTQIKYIGEQHLEEYLEDLHENYETRNTLFGFKDNRTSDNTIYLKTSKDSIKGALFHQKIPEKMRSELNLLLNTSDFTSGINITKPELSILMEIILKYLHYTQTSKTAYYYNKLEYATLNLKN